MDYKLVKELKEAGFPELKYLETCREEVYPTLEELIEAFGENKTIKLQSYYDKNDLMWQADTAGNFRNWLPSDTSEVGPTPAIAVAKLWLAINKK